MSKENTSQQKQIFIIGGPNGAGKTTSSFALMPSILHCEEYVNADAIASSLSPFKPESVAIQAGKLMLERIHKLIDAGKNFAFETTLASKSFAQLLQQCKKVNYYTTLLYCWLADPELAIARVKQRHTNGGHLIPPEVVTRRFYRSQNNLIQLYIPIADRTLIYNNSNTPATLIAQCYGLDNLTIYDQDIWNQINERKSRND